MADRRHRRWIIPLLIGFACTTVAITAYRFGLLEPLEGYTYNLRMNLSRSDTSTHPDIAIVLIDDNSIKTLEPVVGRWPWPRSIYADLLEYLSLGGPKAVLFDVTFHEKQKTTNALAIDKHDARLVEATTEYPFVYHASRFVVDKEDDVNKNLLHRPLAKEVLAASSISQRYHLSEPTNLTSPSNNVFYLPFDELLKVSPNLGAVDVNPDSDGVYRRARLFHRYGDAAFASLSVTGYLDQIKPKRIVRTSDNIEIDEFHIPVDASEQVLVNYYTNFDTYSFGGLIASLQQIQRGDLEHLMVDPGIFKDKYVFIGGSAAGTEDLKVTPVDGRLPGVMVHASILSNILERSFLTPPETAVTIIFILILSFVITFGVLSSKKSWQQNSIPSLVIVLFVAISFILFYRHYVLEIVAPVLAGSMAWISAFSFLVFTEGKEKRKFKRMMSQYLSPAVLQTVVDNAEEFARAEIGRSERISILFSDIRGFTTLSEQLPAEKVVEILNFYFSNMTEAIFKHEGTIDKFIGDAIMAFWGAPIRIQNHADQSVQAAIAMLEKLTHVNAWLKEKNYPPIAIGIGIHTGEVILGNIGSEHKLDYTIIGDNVNLASRMEGITKTYESPILLTENTVQSMLNPMPCRAVDLVKVKGKHKPIKIYQPVTPLVVTLPPELTAQRCAELSEQTFAHYLKRDWQAALQCCASLPDDAITHLMVERCKYAMENPPDESWDGSFTMKSK